MDLIIEKYALENAVRYKGKANPGAVIGSCIKENDSLKSDMKTLGKKVSEIVKKVNALSFEEQKAKLESLAPELLEKKKGEKKGLFDSFKVEGSVVTAFPPEPSKYMHIGHAKALFINYCFAKKFNGKFILRFEDTNPELAKKEFYDILLKDVKWLGVKPDSVQYASDHMLDFYRFCDKLINLGKAYICTCPQEKIREGRMSGKPCDCRYNHIRENLIAWKNMPDYKEGEAIVRLKIDLKHKNSTMRDPTIFRIIKKPHCRVGKKYIVWPNYDFENAVMDGLQGVTHRFRSKEFEMRNELQRYIQRLLSLPETSILEFARFNLKGVESSGRKIRELINNNELTGWDDPSLTTLIALKRRGFLPEAIKNFVLSTGITKSESTLTWDDFIMHNKRLLDSDCNRYFFIKDPVRVRIHDAPSKVVKLKLHPEDVKKGFRTFKTNELFYLSKDDFSMIQDKKIYRLMDCINFVKKKDYFVYLDDKLETYKNSGDMIVHWLPFEMKKLVEVDVLMPDNKVVCGLAEPLVWNLKNGSIVQFERFGFCRLDKKNKTKLYFRFTHK
ncbi:MAG: glutamate--tRNA ligase [Nanoarchaeota archaeon]|nr:glutamate--tRNA ligase [Nanoarchaeota archaeon]MBU1855252.1 glutamate--tRNA ligase [Nanoarchaeota archaeon]